MAVAPSFRRSVVPFSAHRRVDTRVVLGAAALNGALIVALLLGWGSLALALGVLVPLALALRRRPQLGVLALAALVPFNGLLLVIPHPQIAQSWKEGVVLATLAATFVAPAEARAPKGRRLPRWLAAVSLLVLLGLVSGAVVGGQQALTGLRIDFFYLLLAWAIWRCPPSRVDRDRLVTILMATGVITALVGLAQQVVGATRLNDLGYQYNSVIRFAGGFLRSFSTFSDPFQFGFFLMLVLLVGLALALEDPRRTRNRLFLFAVPLLVLGLASSVVRGAWLGLAAGLLYLGWRRHRRLLLIIPVALVALLYLPGSLSSAALSGTSLAERGSGWQANTQQIVAHPLGAGIGATGAAAAKVAALQGGGTTYQPDNYYFKTVYELGLLGLWLLVVALFTIFGSTDRTALRLSGSDGALVRGVSAGVLAAIMASFVATYFEIFPMDVLFWLLLGVVATLDTG
jgi:O-Antigen ligase